MEVEDCSAYRPTPLDFASFVHYACSQLEAPFAVKILEHTEVEPKVRKSRQSAHFSPRSTATVVDLSSVVSSSPPYEPHDITIIVVRDVSSRITKLVFWKYKQIPPLLLRVVGICVPYHLYLTKLEVRRGPSHGLGLKEIARILAHSYLSEICLDDSPLVQRNFHILFEANTTLRRLSLARCGIDDEACASLASRLNYPHPASESLVSLSLTSNFITDEGAKAVRNTLRGNRALLHLDIAGNFLTDAGAAVILQPLMEFPLTEEEVANKLHVERLMLKLRINDEWRRETQDEERPSVAKSSNGKQRYRGTAAMAASLQSECEDVTAQYSGRQKNEVGDTQNYPFSINQTYLRNGKVFSLGNMRLAFLNLAYNNLDICTATLLRRVLSYQVARRAKLPEHSVHRGLSRIVLDGNPMPKACEELKQMKALLEKTMITKHVKTRHHKTRDKMQ